MTAAGERASFGPHRFRIFGRLKDVDLTPSYRTAWAVVAAYRGGWRACEARIVSADMGAAISTALATPELVLERLANESMHGWQTRAVRQVVAYGLSKR